MHEQIFLTVKTLKSIDNRLSTKCNKNEKKDANYDIIKCSNYAEMK